MSDEKAAHVRASSVEQIHAAIDHLKKGEFVSAISLGSAAEGILPEPDEPYLRRKIEEMAKALPEEPGTTNDPNAFNNWSKHGENDKRPDKAKISEQEGITTILRAISKFVTLYDARTPQMRSFGEWATKRLSEDKGVSK